jgi:hypothetical protein
MTSGMGRDFRSSLGAGLSALAAGFDSALSGSDFMIAVLLSLLSPPGSNLGKSWRLVEEALKEAH